MFLHLLQQNYENQHVTMELERIKSDNLSAQYELLKQQVCPHFLFNSLNTLKAMVESGEQESVDFIIKLSNFYRFTLESRKLDLIHVSEEMEILNAYLFQKARFEDGFTFESTLSPTTLKTLIPPFTLQLLVENCIKHNVVSLEKPLRIRIYEEEDKIIVENQVQQKTGEQNSLGVGLKNIDLRYQHLLNQHIDIVADEKVFKSNFRLFMNIIIIEDELKTAKSLANIILGLRPGDKITGQYQSVAGSVSALSEGPMPDLIFMDIQLADGLCFEIFKSVKITCPVIFCTAYDEYSLEAFKNNEVDYVLKPFSKQDIQDALRKVDELKNFFQQKAVPDLGDLLSKLAPPSGKTSFLIFQNQKYKTINVEDIAFFYIRR